MKVLITGASSGMGKDMANVFASKGYDLVLVARDEKKLNEVKRNILEVYKVKVEAIALDLASIENCKKLHKDVDNVDILVNNAGFGDCGNFTKTSLDKEIKMIETNVIAYHILTKLYLIDMKKRCSGKILNVASIAGLMSGGPLMATYYATKSYVVSLSEAIRVELQKEKSNVTISILCPGPVDTNFNNVANVDFHMREANSMQTAKYAIKNLEKGKFYIVPGTDVKLAKIASKISPSILNSKVTYMVQKRKLKGK